MEDLLTLDQQIQDIENEEKNAGRFEFSATVTKAFKDNLGRMHVRAVASDTLPDFHRDRMDKSAIEMMARQLKTKKIDLLQSHSDTFGFGYSIDAKSVKKEGNIRELEVEFVLKESFPQSIELYRNVCSNDPYKHNFQLSIGGRVNLDDPDAIDFELDDDTGMFVRVIKKIELDHVATTRSKNAANDRARMLSAMIKSNGKMFSSIFKSLDGIESNDKYSDFHVPALKSIVPFKEFPLAEKDLNWEFGANEEKEILEKGGLKLIKAVSAWFNRERSSVPMEKTDYLFVHHSIVDGQIKTVAKGVISAMADLKKSLDSGDNKISQDERKEIHAHLALHFDEFDLEAPSLKSLDEMSFEEYIDFINKQGFDASFLEVNSMGQKNLNLDTGLNKDAFSVSELLFSNLEKAFSDVEKGIPVSELKGPFGERVRRIASALEAAVEHLPGGNNAAKSNDSNVSAISQEQMSQIADAVTKNVMGAYEIGLESIAKSMSAQIGSDRISKSVEDLSEKISKSSEETKKALDSANEKVDEIAQRVSALEKGGGDSNTNPLSPKQPSFEQPPTPTNTQGGGIFKGSLGAAYSQFRAAKNC